MSDDCKHSEKNRDDCNAAQTRHECQRCGSDEWEYVDYGGCSVCRSYEDRAAEDEDATGVGARHGTCPSCRGMKFDLSTESGKLEAARLALRDWIVNGDEQAKADLLEMLDV